MRDLFIYNTGDKDTEHVMFYATENANLSHFVIVDSTYDADGKPSNKLRHFYAFPDYLVKKDDLIVLWTKIGPQKVSKASSGVPQHNFYWGLNENVWNVNGDVAHLLDIRTALTKKVGKRTA